MLSFYASLPVNYNFILSFQWLVQTYSSIRLKFQNIADLLKF